MRIGLPAQCYRWGSLASGGRPYLRPRELLQIRFGPDRDGDGHVSVREVTDYVTQGLRIEGAGKTLQRYGHLEGTFYRAEATGRWVPPGKLQKTVVLPPGRISAPGP